MSEEHDTRSELPAKKVVLEKDRDGWIVRNQGDSAILYSSSEREPALNFAQDMAEKHELDLDIKDYEDSEETEETSVDHNIVVSQTDGKWEVYHEDDTAVLFTASLKEQALKFAEEMAEKYELKVLVRD